MKARTPLPDFVSDFLQEGLQTSIDERYGIVTIQKSSNRYGEEMTAKGRKCAWTECGKMFLPKGKNGKGRFCSDACKMASYRHEHRMNKKRVAL